LFSADSDAVIVAACKPAEDGDGVIVRVRECNGSPQTVRLRCGARMTEAAAVDALERGIDGLVTIEEESLIFELEPRQLRSFRVRFRHGA
jgi:alpha-mannosidase